MKRKSPAIPLTLLSVLFLLGAINAQVIDYSTLIKVERGKKITEKKFLIQVDDKESNELAHVEVEHSSSQKFTLIKASIIDSRGNVVRKLRKKDVLTKSDRSYQAFYQDDLIEEFDLYWNEYPYQAEYVYRIIEDEFIYISTWYPLASIKTNTLQSSLMVELPREYEIAMDYSSELSFNQIITEDKRILEWKSGNQEFPEIEIYTPSLREILPHVFIVPKSFDYGIQGTTSSWLSYGQWYVDLNRGADELPLSEQQVVNQLIDGVSDEREKVNILYQYLQDETKYVNVSIELGGLKSYPATYVSENKYGDCKALTTYMYAMLKYAGISSYPVLINAGERAEEINKDFPSQQFSHVMLMVPLNGDTIWLENTSNTEPVNYLSAFYHDRYALMIKENGSQLVRTPKLCELDVLEKRLYTFTQKDHESWTVTIEKLIKGRLFEKYLYYKMHSGLKDQEGLVTSDIDLSLFDLHEWDIRSVDREDTDIEVFASGSCQSPLRSVGQWQVINPLQVKIPAFEDPGKRNLKVKINFPIYKSDSLIYDLSPFEGHDIQIPENIVIEDFYGSYRTTYQITNDILTVTERFLLHPGNYSLETYPAFYSFLDAIKKHKKSSAIIIK